MHQVVLQNIKLQSKQVWTEMDNMQGWPVLRLYIRGLTPYWQANALACQKDVRPPIYNLNSQNRLSAPYMTVCMVISLLKITYVHRVYL